MKCEKNLEKCEKCGVCIKIIEKKKLYKNNEE